MSRAEYAGACRRVAILRPRLSRSNRFDVRRDLDVGGEPPRAGGKVATAESGSSPATAATRSAAVASGRRAPWTDRSIALFLILTFLLGTFPLKDADIYWHLRTGDLIRQTGKVPQTDIFTFTREGTPWIDLHWIFQVAISWLHEQGGVLALNVAKCVVTCLAMLILLSARKREWPIPVMVLAWLPALLVLGGRIYVRPETLTLLYLSIFLAVICGGIDFRYSRSCCRWFRSRGSTRRDCSCWDR